MKKIGFLSFGVMLVITILILQKEGLAADMKRILYKVTHDIESGVIKAYQEIRSFVIQFDAL